MSSIPVDVLRMILEHVEELADLVTLCKVNKICCSCSQDVLYRHIWTVGTRIRVIRTLAHSTDLARRVRSFHTDRFDPEHTSQFYTVLRQALQNMSSLRELWFESIYDASILDGCTFKLDSFDSAFPYSESLRNFLNSQPSLTKIILTKIFKLPSESSPFEESCLPNLTQVTAVPSWLPILIPGRPVGEVTILECDHTVDDFDFNFDFNFFTLSTAPIQKLSIPGIYLSPKSGSLLASVFPSLVHLTVDIDYDYWLVRHLQLFI
jgi:hypothetical protein